MADVQAGQASVLSSLGSLQAGQAALSSPRGAVQTLSMVSLGFAALLPVAPGTQFRALSSRLDALARAVRGLDK